MSHDQANHVPMSTISTVDSKHFLNRMNPDLDLEFDRQNIGIELLLKLQTCASLKISLTRISPEPCKYARIYQGY